MARAVRLRPIRGRSFGRTRALAGTGLAAAVLVPVELALQRLSRRSRPRLPWLFHRALARSLGIHVVVHGRAARPGGVLFVVNHLSWVDIPVLGSRILAAFVAKSEVAGWGPVGYLSTLARTVYVERERRQATGDARNAIVERLAAGENVILFPEGTNGDGVAVLPFKSALFAAIEGGGADGVDDFIIQPVTLAYTRLNGMPITRRQLPDIAWLGETALMPHLMAFMSLGRVRAEIRFHAAVRASDFADRKALARHCQTVVADGYRRLMRGT
jgi:1-acyl-sn-glycerol-3-phosphate acyltransferase